MDSDSLETTIQAVQAFVDISESITIVALLLARVFQQDKLLQLYRDQQIKRLNRLEEEILTDKK